MAKIAGRQTEIGIGIETTPGTAVAATDYIKWDQFSFQAVTDKTLLNSARGIRNKISNSIITKQYGKGTIEFSPTVDILPYILGLTLGTRSSGTHAGETTVYDHTFSVQNANASMKTATILVAEGGIQTERFANSVVDSFDLTIGKDLAKAKIGLIGNFSDTSSISSAYTQDTLFAQNDMVATFGTSFANATATKATQTLTSTGVFSDGDTITIGNIAGPAITYTMKTALTNNGNTPYEVLIGGSASVSLDNLRSAIDGLSGAGTTYGNGTVQHQSVLATTKTATTLVVQAIQGGTGGNAITTTKSAANFTWGSTTLSGGSGNNPTPLVEFTLSINNNVMFDDAFLSGAATPVNGGFIAGPLQIKGSYTLQFADVVELGKYKNNTNSAMIVQLNGAALGTVPTQEAIIIKLGKLILTKAPLEYNLDGLVYVKQEFEVQYDATDKEISAIVTNNYVGTNYQ